MSLEENIAALTKAIEANTAALKAGGGAKAGGTASAGAAGYKAKHSVTDMQKTLEELKLKTIDGDDKGGLAAAKTIIAEIGKVKKLAEITDPAVIDKVYEAAAAKLAELAAAEEEM